MAIITKRKRVKRLTSLRGSDLQQVVCKPDVIISRSPRHIDISSWIFCNRSHVKWPPPPPLLSLSSSSSSSPWYNRTGWLGVKLQFTYSSSSSLFVCLFVFGRFKEAQSTDNFRFTCLWWLKKVLSQRGAHVSDCRIKISLTFCTVAYCFLLSCTIKHMPKTLIWKKNLFFMSVNLVKPCFLMTG